MTDDIRRLRREIRQRLEMLGRAGLNWIDQPRWPERPSPVSPPIASSPAAPPPPPAAPEPIPPQRTKPPDPPPSIPRPATPPPSLFAPTGFDTPEIPVAGRPLLLEALALEVSQCTRCPDLVRSRTKTVFGVGNLKPRLMFIGEGPGEDEDRVGEPFVGRAGQLLNDMITKGMGLKRSDVYIANTVKCRPTDAAGKNRQPDLVEMTNCRPYLEQQIAILRPEFLCLLGKSAAVSMLDTGAPMGQLRQRWHRYKSIPTIVTFHPAYLLRTPTAKKDAWDDLKLLMQAMGLKPQAKGADT